MAPIEPFANCYNQNHQKSMVMSLPNEICEIFKFQLDKLWPNMPIWPQHGLSNMMVKPIKYCIFRLRGLQKVKHEILTSACLRIKNALTCILKNQKSIIAPAGLAYCGNIDDSYKHMVMTRLMVQPARFRACDEVRN